MSDFQKRLFDFLTECKHDALMELTENETYVARKQEHTEILNALLQNMTPECRELFDRFQEAAGTVNGIELDYCYLCAIRDYLSIERQFKKPLDTEWSGLVSYIIPDDIDKCE